MQHFALTIIAVTDPALFRVPLKSSTKSAAMLLTQVTTFSVANSP